jgi:hypothetical protein
LVNWCGANDLNCFMYTRRQSGLAATTDQAIMSGRPLLTGCNDTFRHIHRYIPPYPITSLRQAMETTAPLVCSMQDDWSRTSFNKTFHRMLATFGLITLRAADQAAVATKEGPTATIMVASRRRSHGNDILDYATRLADCLGRSGEYDVRRAGCDDLPDLAEQAAKLRPSAAIVLDFPDIERAALALKAVAGPKVLLVDEPKVGNGVSTEDNPLVLPRKPIVPYFTAGGGLRDGPPSIWLIGFAARQSNLEQVVAQIHRDLPEAAVFLEAPHERRSDFESRVSRLRRRLHLAKQVCLSVVTLPTAGAEIISSLAGDRSIIFYNDPERTEDLQNLSCLAMTTERSVAFTRAAPFPHFLDHGTYVEDLNLAEIINMGIAAQIKLCHEFSEGQLYASMHALLSEQAADLLPRFQTGLSVSSPHATSSEDEGRGEMESISARSDRTRRSSAD